MGKGDLRTRRGKIYNGSFGKTRPGRKPAKAAAPTPASGKGDNRLTLGSRK
jgi:30S ribosomal protein S31